MRRRGRIFGAILVSFIAVLSVSILSRDGFSAEKFPLREIVIVVPYSAGGPTDLSFRVLAEYLKKELPVPVVVENRPEAGGVKGVVDVYRARPDGYTLLANIFPGQATMEIVQKAPFKNLDFTFIAAFQKFTSFLAVRKESPYRTVGDLIEASKTKPLSCSVSGAGNRSYMNAVVLKNKLGINLEWVVFKGSAPAVMALLGGHVDLTTMEDLTLLLHKDKVRCLAIFSDERSQNFPDVPTFKELGYSVPILSSIQGLTGPPGLPQEVYKILLNASGKAMKNPELIKKIKEFGPTPVYVPGPEFRAEVESIYKMVEAYKEVMSSK